MADLVNAMTVITDPGPRIEYSRTFRAEMFSSEYCTLRGNTPLVMMWMIGRTCNNESIPSYDKSLLHEIKVIRIGSDRIG